MVFENKINLRNIGGFVVRQKRQYFNGIRFAIQVGKIFEPTQKIRKIIQPEMYTTTYRVIESWQTILNPYIELCYLMFHKNSHLNLSMILSSHKKVQLGKVPFVCKLLVTIMLNHKNQMTCRN
jgi:hypothetical protein